MLFLLHREMIRQSSAIFPATAKIAKRTVRFFLGRDVKKVLSDLFADNRYRRNVGVYRRYLSRNIADITSPRVATSQKIRARSFDISNGFSRKIVVRRKNYSKIRICSIFRYYEL